MIQSYRAWRDDKARSITCPKNAVRSPIFSKPEKERLEDGMKGCEEDLATCHLPCANNHVGQGKLGSVCRHMSSRHLTRHVTPKNIVPLSSISGKGNSEQEVPTSTVLKGKTFLAVVLVGGLTWRIERCDRMILSICWCLSSISLCKTKCSLNALLLSL